MPAAGTHPLVVSLNGVRHRIRMGDWWVRCANVDVEELREEIRADAFAQRRARVLQGDSLSPAERSFLRQAVSAEQKRRWKANEKLDISMSKAAGEGGWR